MEFLLGRYRNLIMLVGVLFLQVLGLAVQVKRSGDPQNSRLIRIWAVESVTPFEKLVVWTENGGRNLWRDYFFLRGVRSENRGLKLQIEKLRLDQVRLSEDAEQAHRLQLLMGFREQFISHTVPAQVIGSSASDLSRSIYIDKGSNDKIAPDMAVITAGGIVGKVLRVYPSTALVLMINDQSSGVGAMLEKSRLQGVLRGTPEGDVILERVMSDEQVAPGETVISSGGDQIFPKGLPVGTVTSVKPGHEMFLSIHIKPSADLNRLEEVLVVTEKQEQNPVAEGAGRVRAADILASRLPSVPDKLVAPAAVPASGPAGGVSPPAANPAPGGKVSAAAIPPPTVRKPLAQAVSGRGALPVQANSQPPSAVNAANRNPTLNAATANQVSQSANAAAKKAPVKLTAVPAPANPISTTGSGNTPQATLAFAPNKPKAQPPKPPADPSTAAADTPH